MRKIFELSRLEDTISRYTLENLGSVLREASAKFGASPACHICGRPVSLETSLTDAGGSPVHEACYVEIVSKPAARG